MPAHCGRRAVTASSGCGIVGRRLNEQGKHRWKQRQDDGGRGEAAGWWERFFLVGIAAKGLNGAAEIIGGIALLLAGPRSLNGIALALTRNELTEDPNDFIATHLLHITERATHGSVLFAAIYLLIHGVVKLVLVVAILRGKIWAYPWMIGVLVVFVAYQGYQISIAPSAGLVALTVFDAIVAYLTWHEYKRHRRRAAAFG